MRFSEEQGSGRADPCGCFKDLLVKAHSKGSETTPVEASAQGLR